MASAFTVSARRGVSLEDIGGAPGFTLLSGDVRVFSRLDLCYNTGHEADVEFGATFDGEFARFHDCTENG